MSEYIQTTGARQVLIFNSILNYYCYSSDYPPLDRSFLVVDIGKNFSINSAELILQIVGHANGFHLYKNPNYYLKGFSGYGQYEIESNTEITDCGGPWSINSMTPATYKSQNIKNHLNRGKNVFYFDTPVYTTDEYAALFASIVVDGFFERLT